MRNKAVGLRLKARGRDIWVSGRLSLEIRVLDILTLDATVLQTCPSEPFDKLRIGCVEGPKRVQVESVFSAIKRKLAAKAPGRSEETQRQQAMLLGVACNIYRL